MILNDESTGVYSILTENARYTINLEDRMLIREPLVDNAELRKDEVPIPVIAVANTIEIGKPMILMIQVIEEAWTMRQTSIVQDIERVG